MKAVWNSRNRLNCAGKRDRLFAREKKEPLKVGAGPPFKADKSFSGHFGFTYFLPSPKNECDPPSFFSDKNTRTPHFHVFWQQFLFELVQEPIRALYGQQARQLRYSSLPY